MVPPRRSGRRSTRSAVQRTPTPPPPEPSDSEMVDVPSNPATPQNDAPSGIDASGEGQEPDVEEEEDEEEEDANEGGDEDEGSSMPGTSPAPSSRARRGVRSTRGAKSGGQSPTPVKRRPGRPPKYPRQLEGSDREGSDATPRRGRGGWRGGRGFGGGRWKNKNLQRQQAQPVDKDGQPLEVENDEAKMDEDPDGEQKVDKDGYLQGGREYRVRTFTIEGKGRRLYMLSTEPARCIGFRDSYLFFQKHRMLYKIILTDDDKLDLIDRDLMPHSYKGRTIGVVTARSVFREFGAAIIIGGRKISDDYRVADMLAEGALEGDLAVPDDILPGAGEEYDRNRYVAWHGASQVYHTAAPALPVPGAKAELKKRKVTVTGSNWMLEHAREASRFNSGLATARIYAMKGVYEIHTNQMHYPRITQPTHAKWEQINQQDNAITDIEREIAAVDLRAASTDLTNGLNVDNETDDLQGITSDSANASNGLQPVPANSNSGKEKYSTEPPQRAFSKPSAYQLRNFATVDTQFVYPRYTGLGRPGPDAATYRLPGESPGLVGVPKEVAELLPAECRAAFEEAKHDEMKWKSSWETEARDGLRVPPRVTFRA